MKKEIQKILGNSYSWDAELNELNYRGSPLSGFITPYESASVKQAIKNLSMNLAAPKEKYASE